MPREVVLADLVTVRRGDLPVLAARTRADVPPLAQAALDQLTDCPPESHSGESGESPAFADATNRELVRQLQASHTALRASDGEVRALRAELADQRAAWFVLRRRYQLCVQFVVDLEAADEETPTHDDFTRQFRRRTTELRDALARLPQPGDPDPAPDPTARSTTRDAAHSVPADPATTGPSWRTPAPDCPRRNYVHAAHRDPGPPGSDRPPLDCPGFGPAREPADLEPQLDAALATDLTGSALPDSDDSDDSDDPNLPVDPADDPADDVVRVRLGVQLSWVRDGGTVNVGVVAFDEDTSDPLDVGGFHATLDWAAANKLIKKTRTGRDQSHGTPE